MKLWCLLFNESFLVPFILFCWFGIQTVLSNEVTITQQASLDNLEASKPFSTDMNARQVVAQLQREKKELARRLEKQQYDLKLVKMERSLDIQRKHEKEAEESYLLELETELNKRIAELQPSLENLEQKRRKLEDDIEVKGPFGW